MDRIRVLNVRMGQGDQKSQSLNQAKGLVDAVKANPGYDPFSAQTGVFNGYVYKEGMAQEFAHPVLAESELPSPPGGRAWVDVLNSTGTSYMWTLKKAEAGAPQVERIEKDWGWLVHDVSPNVSCLEEIDTVDIWDSRGLRVDSVTLPNGCWSVELKNGYKTTGPQFPWERVWGRVDVRVGGSCLPVVDILDVCDSTGKKVDSVTLPDDCYGATFNPGYGRCSKGTTQSEDGIAPAPSGTSVAEKLSGAAAISAIGVIALVVAGIVVKK